MARRQEEPYKRCKCGGKVYTSERGKKRNGNNGMCANCTAQDIIDATIARIRNGNS